MKFINQRQNPRIDVRLRCRVSALGLCSGDQMWTENISRNGMLVIWRSALAGELPHVGQFVTVEVELPANHGFGRKCMHCQAQVVRVTTAGKDFPRVALSVNYMKFRAYHDNFSAL